VAEKDRWASWIAKCRSCDDSEQRRRGHEQLVRYRDRVLANAALSEGETLLDVGCGEGLVAFGALECGAGTVVFSDVSQDLLDFCRNVAGELGVLGRCRFELTSADDLGVIESDSVDVVTTRSVLIYVDDKAAALREFFRVLRPGGRVSIFEPINRFSRTDADTWLGYDLGAIPDISKKIRAVYEAIQPPETDPMLDFDERDLVALAEAAGFFPIHVQLEAEIRAHELRSWDAFLNTAGNPRIPTIAEAIEQVLTPNERGRFTAYVRPLVEEGRGVWRMAVAYLFATKPAPSSTRPT
jgi:arsenite methyltransferase